MTKPTEGIDDERGDDGDRDADPGDRPHDRDIKVTVSFSMSDRPDFESRFAGSATVGLVRKAAMAHFAADEDPNHNYYLTHDRERHNDDLTLVEVAHNAKQMKFRLIKELTQG